MKEKLKLTPLERSWILYDIGNSAFVLLVATLVPLYFNALGAQGGLEESLYLSYWGYAGSIATILVAIIAPICGALADHSAKKPIFLLSVLLGVLGCAALGFAGHYLAFLAVFVLAKVGFSSSLVFYDSMLPEVTTPEHMDNVSAQGYAWGYIGSVIPFIVCLVLVLLSDRFGLSMTQAMGISFWITALWWLVCTLPLLRRYRQQAVSSGKPEISKAFTQLYTTLKDARKQPHIFLYLVAFFFFIDGVYTIIDMATAYGAALGLDSTGLLLALLLTQFVAFPFAILFGRLAYLYGASLLIKISILAYMGITLFAVFLVSQWQFWLLAVLVGMFQGGIQSMSRSYLGKIIPPEQSGEYFGLMDIFGKGASFLGMTLVAFISQLTAGMQFRIFGLQLQSANIAVGVLLILFLLGFCFFCKADKLNQNR